jgi:hypothetical protein
MIDLPNEKRMCHLTGFKQSCRALVTCGKCERWVNVQGRHPQTDEIINRYNCIDDWQYLLLIENSKLQRETGAAVESFRNEMVVANERNAVLQSHELRRQLIEAARPHVNGMLEHGKDEEDG